MTTNVLVNLHYRMRRSITFQTILISQRNYRIDSVFGTRLYFSQQILPNISECSLSDINYLLNWMKNATRIYANISTPKILFSIMIAI